MADELVPVSEPWLTYIEAAERLGVSVEAVRAMVRRDGWPEQRANGIGQVVRVQVPPDLLTNGRPLATTGGATAGLPLAMREAIETAGGGGWGGMGGGPARAPQRGGGGGRAGRGVPAG